MGTLPVTFSRSIPVGGVPIIEPLTPALAPGASFVHCAACRIACGSTVRWSRPRAGDSRSWRPIRLTTGSGLQPPPATWTNWRPVWNDGPPYLCPACRRFRVAGKAGVLGYALGQALETLPRPAYDEFLTPALGSRLV